MIYEYFVSFEVAKLLKERGFDGYNKRIYKSNGKSRTLGWNATNEQLDKHEYLKGSCVSPTHQMVMMWLMKVHKLLISVDASPIYGKVKDEKGRNTCGLLYWYYMASGVWINDKFNPQQRAFVASGKSYEEAVEAALKYSLENLL